MNPQSERMRLEKLVARFNKQFPVGSPVIVKHGNIRQLGVVFNSASLVYVDDAGGSRGRRSMATAFVNGAGQIDLSRSEISSAKDQFDAIRREFVLAGFNLASKHASGGDFFDRLAVQTGQLLAFLQLAQSHLKTTATTDQIEALIGQLHKMAIRGLKRCSAENSTEVPRRPG